MREIPPKVVKLLTLALDNAAGVGEWQNAAIMLVSSLRKEGFMVEEIIRPKKAKPRIHHGGIVMPFGKFKGVSITELPDAYIDWLIGSTLLREPLRTNIQNERDRRDQE